MIASTSGVPRARSGRRYSSPAAMSPAQVTISPTIGVPCTSVGKTGSGGASRRLAISPSSSGASAMKSRRNASTGRRLGGRPRDQPGEDRRPERLEVEGEVRDDAEVAPAASQSPEEVGVLLGAGRHELPVRRHHVALAQGVDGQPELPHQVTDAAAQRQSGDTGVADEPARRGQPELLRLAVDVRLQAAALGLDGARDRVDAGAGHRRQVDHDRRRRAPRARPRRARRRGPRRAGRARGRSGSRPRRRLLPGSRAMRPGRRWISPFQTWRAASYAGWSRSMSSPLKCGASASTLGVLVANVVMDLPPCGVCSFRVGRAGSGPPVPIVYWYRTHSGPTVRG